MTRGRHPIPVRTKDKKRTGQNPATALAAAAVDACLSKKGRDVTVMDLRTVSGVADFFVICTGDSDVQIKALAESIKDAIKSHLGEKPWHSEGYDHLQWVLLDYVDVVAHVFNEERRAFYDLERLWGDAITETVADDGSSADVTFLAEKA